MSLRKTFVACAATLALASCVENGRPGQDGKNSLMKVISEPAGVNCPNGGSAIQSGLDTNGDGQLDTSEVASTAYVCNGGDGRAIALVKLVPEPAGANCASGGTAAKSGLDASGNGTLEDSEVTSTAYVCNGDNGMQALVSLVTEPPGANCSAGGTAVKSGLDTNGNGTLDAPEVTSTRYICSAGSVFATKWASVTAGLWTGEIPFNTFIPVNGPVRIFKTSPTSRLKVTINDSFRVNWDYAGWGMGVVVLRMNGGVIAVTGQHTHTWTSGGASYGNNFHLPYADVVVTDQLPVGLYEFDLMAQGHWTGQFTGTSHMGWGQSRRSVLVEEIDGATLAISQGGGEDVTTSATFTRASGRTVTYNKQSASTLLKVTLADTLRVGYGQSPGSGAVMIRMDGADTVCQIAQSVHVGGGSAAADIHRPFVETCILTNIAPGNHTFTVWFNSSSGGQTHLGWYHWPKTLLVEELPMAGRSFQTTGTASGDLSGGWSGVPGRLVNHAVSAPNKTLKVTFSDQFRAVNGCNGTAGFYQIFINGNPTDCYGGQYVWNNGPSPSNDQHYPINHTCIFPNMTAATHTFAVYSTTNDIYSPSIPQPSCGSNHFGWNRGQSLILVEELP